MSILAPSLPPRRHRVGFRTDGRYRHVIFHAYCRLVSHTYCVGTKRRAYVQVWFCRCRAVEHRVCNRLAKEVASSVVLEPPEENNGRRRKRYVGPYRIKVHALLRSCSRDHGHENPCGRHSRKEEPAIVLPIGIIKCGTNDAYVAAWPELMDGMREVTSPQGSEAPARRPDPLQHVLGTARCCISGALTSGTCALQEMARTTATRALR